jgi:Kef-type K+ transport system membrane component KefB
VESGAYAQTLLFVGGGLLLGFVAHVVGRRAHVPRVTLLLVIGALAGPSALDIVPGGVDRYLPLVSQAALSLVGFVLGQHFRAERLRKTARIALVSSVTGTVVPAVLVFVALLLAGGGLLTALLVASIAGATAPAATTDVFRELRAKGPLTDITLEVVAIDDAWSVLLFLLLLTFADALAGGGLSMEHIGHGLYEIVGALALGVAIGLPMAWLTGRVRPGELTMIEALGFVLLAGGLAGLLGVSYLLTCMALGMVVANRARHHERPFHAIEDAMEPFLIVFFLLAGLAFHVESLLALSTLGVAYVLARSLGKVTGGWIGARLSGASRRVQRGLGWCLLPQAGIALGLGLAIAERFGETGDQILQLLIGSTVIFEVLGPIAARIAIVRSGEARVR